MIEQRYYALHWKHKILQALEKIDAADLRKLDSSNQNHQEFLKSLVPINPICAQASVPEPAVLKTVPPDQIIAKLCEAEVELSDVRRFNIEFNLRCNIEFAIMRQI